MGQTAGKHLWACGRCTGVVASHVGTNTPERGEDARCYSCGTYQAFYYVGALSFQVATAQPLPVRELVGKAYSNVVEAVQRWMERSNNPDTVSEHLHQAKDILGVVLEKLP